MNKKDKKLILVCLVLAAVGLAVYYAMVYFRHSNIGIVEYKDEVILEFDVDKDETYEFSGSYGIMHLEVKDGKFRVYDVECPNHNCEQQGWMDKDALTPIVCMPNEVVIRAIEK